MTIDTQMCQHKGCDLQATHWLLWTHPMYLCGFHAALMVATAEALGYDKPRRTKRRLPEHRPIDSKLAQDI